MARIIGVLIAGMLLSVGCTPQTLVLGGGALAVTAGQKEKGFRAATNDFKIQTQVQHHLFEKDHALFSAVTVSVDNGKVLLTGSVEDPNDRIESTRLAWRANGVQEVINEIQVRNKAGFIDRTVDVVINKSLQTRLLFDQHVRSINYSIDTVNAVVYISGVARSQQELDRVIGHARSVKSVRNVVNYATVGGK